MTTCCPICAANRPASTTKVTLIQESQMSSKLESERRLFYVALTRARKGVLIGASENASRFLNEILLRDTDAVMSAVQHLASGEAHSAVNPASKHSSLQRPLPTCSVTWSNGYLPDMGQAPTGTTAPARLAVFLAACWSPSKMITHQFKRASHLKPGAFFFI